MSALRALSLAVLIGLICGSGANAEDRRGGEPWCPAGGQTGLTADTVLDFFRLRGKREMVAIMRRRALLGGTLGGHNLSNRQSAIGDGDGAESDQPRTT
jgi:hypothetical protein